MVTATVTSWFSAAHRVEGHPKCGRLHGHNYKLIVTVARPAHKALGIGNVDDMGFVIDFGILKPIIKKVVGLVDHRYMVSDANMAAVDPYYRAACNADREKEDIVLLAIQETSAELLACWFKNAIQQSLAEEGFLDIAVMEVELWETSKAYATC